MAAAVLTTACGGGSNINPVAFVGPSSSPTVSGTLSDSVTGTPLGPFSRPVSFLPALLEFTAPGHYPRTARVTRDGQDIDLLPSDGGFDLEFYQQFARGSLSGPPQALRILNTTSLSFYVQIEGASGFAAQVASRFEAVARQVVPDLTGGRVQVGRWETGTTPRALASGLVVVERTDEDSDVCGRALIGQAAGHIWIDSNRFCNPAATFAHEIGHALGFTHVTRRGSMMLPEQAFSNLNDSPTEIERVHGAIATAGRAAIAISTSIPSVSSPQFARVRRRTGSSTHSRGSRRKTPSQASTAVVNGTSGG